MSDYPMLISNKLHSFRNFSAQIYKISIVLANTRYFSPLPLFGWKTEFFTYYLIGFHIKQTTPYLCPKPSNGIELSELYRIGKLFLHGDMPPCLVGYEWSYLFTSNGE